MKVYIASYPEWRSEVVEDVFSSREKAELYAKTHKSIDINEWELDKPNDD